MYIYIYKQLNECIYDIGTMKFFLSLTPLYEKVYSPNILAIGSSLRGQNSYSHHADRELGVTVVDRMSFHMLEALKGLYSQYMHI